MADVVEGIAQPRSALLRIAKDVLYLLANRNKDLSVDRYYSLCCSIAGAPFGCAGATVLGAGGRQG